MERWKRVVVWKTGERRSHSDVAWGGGDRLATKKAWVVDGTVRLERIVMTCFREGAAVNLVSWSVTDTSIYKGSRVAN